MSDVTTVDETDIRLVALLEQDGRRTAADMAGQVGLSATAVARRVKRLESGGIIAGYTAWIDHRRLGYGIEALIEVRFVGRERPHEMEHTITKLAEVVSVFTVAGNYDALVWVRTRDVEHLLAIIDTLRVSHGVVDTRSHLVLAVHHPSVAPIAAK